MHQLQRFGAIVLTVIISGCSGLVSPTPTTTPTDVPTSPPTPTETPSTTPTFTATPTPSLTPSPTATPTITPTPSDTPLPTATFTPTTTPIPTVGFVYDNWQFIQAPDNIATLLQQPLIAFTNTNNRPQTSNALTPEPGNDVEILYYATRNGTLIPILETTAATRSQIFIAPTGTSLAYMRYDNNPAVAGLYAIDMTLRTPVSGRILALTSLVQRGIPSEPVWSPDGSRLAIALATGYDMDIFIVGRDGSSPTNLTNNGAYDMFPAWSPDGSQIAFVSDRAICPSWIPGEPGTCDNTGVEPPNGGYLYLLDVNTRAVTPLAEQWITEPPVWVTPRQIAFATGDPAFGSPTRDLWVVDTITRQVRQVRLAGDSDPIKLSEAWSPNGQQVFFQSAGPSSTELVLANVDGTEVGRTGQFTFARYGMSADWSPDGSLLAIGGVNGQCPYGVIVRNAAFAAVATLNAPPSMCEPQFSPDGRSIAFTGVNPRIDGRVDVYVSNTNGYGAVNLTANLRGTIQLLGWVGGQ